MKLDTLALTIILVAFGTFALFYGGMILLVSASLSPWVPIVILLVLAPVAYLAWRVLSDRLNSAEDDYYERNIDR